MAKFCKAIRLTAGTLVILLTASSVNAADEGLYNWNGAWRADGSLFKLSVQVEDGIFTVEPIESLGFEWSTSNGKVSGNQATIEVAYAGVTGVIRVELLSDNEAIASAASCIPEFMVVCALAKDRSALFIRDD